VSEAVPSEKTANEPMSNQIEATNSVGKLKSGAKAKRPDEDR
jgi:hypothetical protein